MTLAANSEMYRVYIFIVDKKTAKFKTKIKTLNQNMETEKDQQNDRCSQIHWSANATRIRWDGIDTK